MTDKGSAETVAAIRSNDDKLQQTNAQLKELDAFLQGVYKQVEGQMDQEMVRLDLLRVIANRLSSQENRTSNERLSMLATCTEIVPVPRFAWPAT